MPLYFDIETEPLPEAQLRAICPPFDPSEVKCGNLGPDKAAAKIAEAEENHFANFSEGAALSPVTGSVAVIGLLKTGDEPWFIDCTLDEKFGIARFWEIASENAAELVGFNTHGFDIPFLIRRSWILGIPIPACMRLEKDRYWPDWNVDLRKRWQLGDNQARGSLDVVATALGLPGKTGDYGKDFGKMWRHAPTRSTAADYLKQDVLLCRALHERLIFAEPAAKEYAMPPDEIDKI